MPYLRATLLALVLAGCAVSPKSGMQCTALTAYDGDTVKCDGVSLRPMGPGAPYVSGFDTPEINQHAKCPGEHELGIAARDRMRDLIRAPGVSIVDSGEVDRFDRPLVWLRLASGATAGEILLAEGHARAWPDGAKFWC
ncbi:MAG: thermonuclease family protein [Pseudomonadota bacterium]